jgi:neutral ceramidase
MPSHAFPLRPKTMPAKPAQWSIGVASRRITPPLGSQMAGFDARKGTAESVHDDLHARALIFDDGSALTAFVSVEVIAVSAEFALATRQRVEQATGIPASHIFLSASHTHCGPVTINHFFNQGQPLDAAYLESLAGGIVAATLAAWKDRRPRTLKSGLVPCNGIAVNRRTQDGLPIDPSAGVILVEEQDGSTAAVAVFYACHTTVLGPNTLSITQDYPYYTLGKLKAVLGAHVEALYFNGAEGDLSIGHKSDLSAVGIVDAFRTFETAQRLGEHLADAVLVELNRLTVEQPAIEVRSATVHLPLKNYKPLAEMTIERQNALLCISSEVSGPEMLATRQRYLFARIEEYYAMLYDNLDVPEPKHLAVELSVIRLGEAIFVTLPGEIFVRIALNIRAASSYPETFFLGLTNDYIGYVPDKNATASSGYEVIASRVPWQAGIVLHDAAAELIASLKKDTEVAVHE